MIGGNSDLDFRVFYEIEPYLFDSVSRCFAEKHVINAMDFFCIVIWKANRSKSKIARRLMASGDTPRSTERAPHSRARSPPVYDVRVCDMSLRLS